MASTTEGRGANRLEGRRSDNQPKERGCLAAHRRRTTDAEALSKDCRRQNDNQPKSRCRGCLAAHTSSNEGWQRRAESLYPI
eukprot:scaffold44204_cov41-Cyclotella_meneghiniana.AAC.1